MRGMHCYANNLLDPDIEQLFSMSLYPTTKSSLASGTRRILTSTWRAFISVIEISK